MVETKLYAEGLVKELIELAKKKNIFIEQGYIFGSYLDISLKGYHPFR